MVTITKLFEYQIYRNNKFFRKHLLSLSFLGVGKKKILKTKK